ncbi:MAG: hypothetical protein DI570_07870 [Phenylobacterium zucineum]|nr:MAG: hypothetical protein DI570_07870 [Phenylobacterium zucineum]
MVAASTPSVSQRPRVAAVRLDPWAMAAALVVFATMALRPGILDDGDTYWHLAVGAWMLDHRQVLDRDIFSFTAAGTRWVSHEWLSEVLMAGAWRLGGWSGLVVLFAAAAASAFGLQARAMARHLPPLSLVLALSLAFALSAKGLLTRPHVLALPLMVGWTVAMLRAREAGRAPHPALALLIVLWANLHGSFIFAFVLAGAFGLEALTTARPDARWRVVRDWGLFGACCAVAATATPHGVAGLIHPFTITGMKTLGVIDEWRPTAFGTLGPFEIALLTTVSVCLYRGVKVPPVRLALLILLTHMALQHQRHQAVLAMVAPLLLAEPVATALAGRAARTFQGRLVAPALALVLLGAMVARLATPIVRGDGENTPVTALAKIPPQLLSRPVLNSYGFGGYVILAGGKVFIDGRADMYGDAAVVRYIDVLAGRPAAVEQAFAQHPIAWTLLEPGAKLVKVMDARPGWRRLYADRYAVIHVREDALR